MSAPPRNKRDTPARLDLDGDALDGFLGGIELRTPTGRKPPSPNLQNIMPKKYRAEVIELYPVHAAVRFKHNGTDRVECVPRASLEIGVKGWAAYNITHSGGLWNFAPYKSSPCMLNPSP